MTLHKFDRLPERDYWVAEWELSRQECAQHPGPIDECSDPEKPWYPQMSVCYAAMEQASAQKRWELKWGKREWHDGSFKSWSEEPNADHPIHRDAGVKIWVSAVDYGVGGDFLGSAPITPGAEQQPDGDDEGNPGE